MKWLPHFTFGFENYFLIFGYVSETSFSISKKTKVTSQVRLPSSLRENSNIFCLIEMIVSNVYFNAKILFICKKCYF